MKLFRCYECTDWKPQIEFSENSGFDKRYVNYRCKQCISILNKLDHSKYNRSLKRWGTICKGCKYPSKLIYGDLCFYCLKNINLKICSKCKEIKKLDEDYYPSNTARCKQCCLKIMTNQYLNKIKSTRAHKKSK